MLECFSTYPILWLNVSGSIQFMLGSSSHMIRCCCYQGPVAIQELFRERRIINLPRIGWFFSKTLEFSTVVLFLGLPYDPCHIPNCQSLKYELICWVILSEWKGCWGQPAFLLRPYEKCQNLLIIKDLEIMQGMVMMTERKWLPLKRHSVLSQGIINLQSKQNSLIGQMSGSCLGRKWKLV